MNLHIVALFRFKENHLFDAIELLKKLVIETRKEEGCLQYDLVEDRENKGKSIRGTWWTTLSLSAGPDCWIFTEKSSGSF